MGHPDPPESTRETLSRVLSGVVWGVAALGILAMLFLVSIGYTPMGTAMFVIVSLSALAFSIDKCNRS